MTTDIQGYGKRSWALLTRDKGWIKPVLVLAASCMIPIVGSFALDGYALEWARLTSWGIDSSPKQRNVDVGACIKSGAKAFVVALGYALVVLFLNTILTSVFDGVVGDLVSFALVTIATVLIIVAKLRATIYQTIGAGYEVTRIADMIKRDYKGLLRIAGLYVVASVVVGIVAGLGVSLVLLANIGDLISLVQSAGYISEYEIVSMVFTWIGGSMPLMFVLIYLVSILSVITTLILTTSVGLWMRQFDVRNWGESSDPLPGTVPSTSQAAPSTQSPAPTTSDAYALPVETASWEQVTTQSGSMQAPSTQDIQREAARMDTWVDVTHDADAQAAHQVPVITPYAPTNTQQEQTTPVTEGEAVSTFDLSDFGASTETASDAQATPAVGDEAPEADLSDFATVETQPQLDEMADATVSTFSLADFDTADAEAPTTQAGAANDEPVTTFSLSDFDAAGAAETEAEPVNVVEESVPMFSLSGPETTIKEPKTQTWSKKPLNPLAPSSDLLDSGAEESALDDAAETAAISEDTAIPTFDLDEGAPIEPEAPAEQPALETLSDSEAPVSLFSLSEADEEPAPAEEPVAPAELADVHEAEDAPVVTSDDEVVEVIDLTDLVHDDEPHDEE